MIAKQPNGVHVATLIRIYANVFTQHQATWTPSALRASLLKWATISFFPLRLLRQQYCREYQDATQQLAHGEYLSEHRPACQYRKNGFETH